MTKQLEPHECEVVAQLEHAANNLTETQQTRLQQARMQAIETATQHTKQRHSLRFIYGSACVVVFSVAGLIFSGQWNEERLTPLPDTLLYGAIGDAEVAMIEDLAFITWLAENEVRL